jgi:hypothetical protein
MTGEPIVSGPFAVTRRATLRKVAGLSLAAPAILRVRRAAAASVVNVTAYDGFILGDGGATASLIRAARQGRLEPERELCARVCNDESSSAQLPARCGPAVAVRLAHHAED